MNKEKQIEEMAKAVCVNCMDEICASGRCAFQWDCPLSMETIKKLYNVGYRKQEWISVEERLPEVRQRVLLYSYHDGVNTGYRADEIGRFYVDKSYPYRPTHWMPLPEAPKGGAE